MNFAIVSRFIRSCWAARRFPAQRDVLVATIAPKRSSCFPILFVPLTLVVLMNDRGVPVRLVTGYGPEALTA